MRYFDISEVIKNEEKQALTPLASRKLLFLLGIQVQEGEQLGNVLMVRITVLYVVNP